MPRTIFYVDPPAFCATVERLVAPDLRSRPIAVAPPGADRATVLALSPEARAAGIARGMLVRRARKLCPDLVLLPPNPRLYARASRALTEILRVYAPVIEPRGYGHAFLDLSGTERLFGPAVDLAERIRRETRDRLRLPLTVGVAGNKLVSEAATRAGRQEDGPWPLLVTGGNEAGFLAPNPLAVLPDVPDDIRTRLDEYQLEVIGQVAAIGESGLAAVFGRRGRLLAAQARGIDARPVLPPEVKAEYRVSQTLATDTNDLAVLHSVLRRLTEALGKRLRQRRLAARRLMVQVDYADYDSACRALTLPIEPLDRELLEAARRALDLALTRRIAVRMITVTVDRLVEANPQLELFTDGRMGEREDGRITLQRAIDAIATVSPRRASLPGQYDLADPSVRLHLAMRRGDRRHGEHRVDHRPERLGERLRLPRAPKRLLDRQVGTEAGQRPGLELRDQPGALAMVPGPHHAADHGEPAAEDRREVGLGRDRALEKSQQDQPAPRREHREVIGKGGTPQHIENQIHRPVELVPEGSPAGVDPGVESQPPQRDQLARRARRSDHRGTRLVGQLDGRGAHPAPGRVDQHPLARLEVPSLHQRVVGGEKRLGNRGRIRRRQIGGHRQHLVLVHHHEFGVGSSTHQAHDPVARLPAGYVRTQALDLPGVLQPWNVLRPAGRRGIGAFALEDVGPIEPGSLHPNPDLPGARIGRGNLAKVQNLGPPAAGMHDGTHDGVKSNHTLPGETPC